MSDTDIIPTAVTPVDLLRLHAGTPAEERKVRNGPGGRPLTYVDARYVQKTLDEIVGSANWQTEFSMGDGGKVSCRIGIRVAFREGIEWVWKGDGAGATDIEGDKGSFSDAFKRAGVAWGIARDLYGEDPVPAPVAQPQQAQPVPQEPVQQAQPVQGAPGAVLYQDIDAADRCPEHGIPWTVKPGGTSRAGKAYNAFWKCDGKTNGSYCNQKVPKAWADAHPIVP
jgi:hypothetical protein